jgi:CubicO group peptidase (beta-lactamase class C family)
MPKRRLVVAAEGEGLSHMPPAKMPRTGTPEMQAEYENINLQQLLSHRAGLPNNFVGDLDSSRSYTATAGRIVYLEQLVQTKLTNHPERLCFTLTPVIYWRA